MNKVEKTLERVVVTFVEAALAYLVVVPGTVTVGKTALAGAIGAGVSAVYNVVRESSPTATVATPPVVVAPVVTPVVAPVEPATPPVEPPAVPPVA